MFWACFSFFFFSIEPVQDELTITDIDLNIYKNTKKHFCDRYDIISKLDVDKKPQIPKLVVRRGFSFEITLRLNRPYYKDKDNISIQLALGMYASASNRTKRKRTDVGVSVIS